MFEARYDWKYDSASVSDLEREIQEKMGISKLLAELLVKRQHTDFDEIREFLLPTENSIHDSYLMHDMQKAIERIQDAIINDEKITVYGDYDADGITSTALMYETLEELGANVDYYIPNRFSDGYGPNMNVYRDLIEQGTKLIVTVDNGVSGYEEVEYAKKQGVDVVITDHHELPEKLPNAVAIVHPRHPEKKYLCPNLTGVGVAFKVASALLEDIPQELLDLVAIGTIADLMPILGENRALVKFGILALQQTSRPGLIALLNNAKVKLSEVNEETIGFVLAPRLNSLGRIQNAQSGVELLTTTDETRAKQIASQVEDLNNRRKELVEKITKEASEVLTTSAAGHSINLVVGKDWHEGVLGIVASHLVEETGRPSIVLSFTKEGNKLKGSGRSIEAFQLFDAIDAHRELFDSFGGHHMACGLTIDVNNLEKFQMALDSEARKQNLNLHKKEILYIDRILDIDMVSPNLINEVNQLAPFGVGNPKPIFSFKNYEVLKPFLMGKSKSHLKMTIKGEKSAADAIAFFIGENGQKLVDGAHNIRFVGNLTTNFWNGQLKPQIMIKDYYIPVEKNAKFKLIDLRKNKLTTNLLKKNGVLFFFNQDIYQKIANLFDDDLEVIVGLKNLSHKKKVKNLVIIDCPNTIEDFGSLLNGISFEELTTVLYPYESVLQSGMPTRQDFICVYRFVIGHKNINLKKDLNRLATYLKIKKDLLIFILKVFFEVGFVRIDNGLMTGLAATKVINLEDTSSYRDRQRLLEVEKTLLMCKTDEFEKIILKLMRV